MTDQSPIEDAYYYKLMRRAIDRDRRRGRARADARGHRAGGGAEPAHFQRVFSRWAGVSPKRFQQFLTLEHAKRLLAERHTTLDTAMEVGLSGTGRLHDLFLRWEAMSPGQFAAAGEGLEIFWGWFESPFGPALVMGTDKGICGIGFAAETGMEATMEDLLGPLAEGAVHGGPDAAAALGPVGLRGGRGA